MLKIKEAREKTDDELAKLLEEERRGLSNLRFQKASSELEKPAQVKKSRRSIARILTVLNERSREAKE